ncbi:MAG: HNH endonuclease [Acidobacteriota bacterium]
MKRAPVAESWDALIERFDKFVSMPCLLGSGPDMKRRLAPISRVKVRAQLDEALGKRLLPRQPKQLTQRHVEKLKSMKTAGRGPAHRALWNGLWRAIIYNCDSYTCFFCHRSAEKGVEIPKCGQLALRLQLDHIEPRSIGGGDFDLLNIRTTCRLCNHGRFRLSEEEFRAELLSLARSVWNRYGDKSATTLGSCSVAEPLEDMFKHD